jgi:ABC-type glycerol-3-phosphate transport system permease component
VKNISPKIFLFILSLYTVIPLIAVLNLSLQKPDALSVSFKISKHLYFGNYLNAWNIGNFHQLFWTSISITLIVVPITTILAVCAGYGFYRFQFPHKRKIFNFLLLGMALPYEAIVIPLYYGLGSIGVLNTIWAVIFPLLGGFMPFGIYWIRSYFSTLPAEILEAATIDGANNRIQLTKILFPISKSAIFSLSIFYFIWSWNQFLLAMILIQDSTKRTVTTGLTAFVNQYSMDLPLMCAGTIIVILPSVVFFIIFQRHIISGVLQGAVK